MELLYNVDSVNESSVTLVKQHGGVYMKTKFLSLLLVLCIVVGCTGITALASTDAKISLTEDFGEISISLTGANTYGGELIVGFYDQYDKACMVKNYKAYDNMTYTLTAPGDAERVKVMWVKSFKSLKPVCPPAEKAITKATVTEIDVNLIDGYSDISNGYIEYYETPESIKTTKIYVSDNAPVYVNGMLYSYGFSFALSVSSYRDATVKFIENTQDKYCDIIEFTIYDYYCVEEVNVASDRIAFGGVSGKSVTFTDFLEDPSYTIAFKDKDGKDIEIADFKAGDVVGVVAADVGKCKPSPTNNVVTYYNLGDRSVIGMITNMHMYSNMVWIDGKSYEVIGNTVGTGYGFKLGDEGKYLLTKTGKIFCCYKINYNVDMAYILDAYFSTIGITGGTLQFKILTDDNEIEIVEAASTFTYHKANGTGASNVSVKTEGNYIAQIYDDTNISTGNADRLVKYKLNDDGRLRSIDAFYTSETISVSNARWYADINILGGNELTADAKIFVIDRYDSSNSFVTSISAFKEDGSYTGILSSYDDYMMTYSAAVITNGIEAEEDTEEEDVLTTYDYGYILDAYFNNSGINAGTLQFQILTDGNKIEIVEAASTFTYLTADGTGASNISVKTEGHYIADIYDDTNIATGNADRLVKYTLNSDNKLRSIEAYTDCNTIIDGTWNTDINTLNGNELTADAKIFVIDRYDSSNSFVTSISAFKEDGSYTGILSDYDYDMMTYSVAAITDGIEAEEDAEEEEILTTYNYGYVLDAYFSTIGITGGTLQFQILTDANEIEIVDAASTFTCPGFNNVKIKHDSDNNYRADGSDIADIYDDTNIATGNADRLVRYKLNSDNLLRSIEAFDDAYNVANTYDKDLSKVGNKYLAEETKIFVINDANLTSSYVTDLSALNEENTYFGTLADYDDNEGTYSLAVFNEADMHHVDKAQGIAVVASIASTVFEGEGATMMTVYSDNDAVAKTLYFTDDSCTYPGNGVNAYNMVDYYNVNAGSVILYTANEKGLVSDYIVLGTFDSTNKVLALSATGIAIASATTADGVTYSYDYGFIDKLASGKVVIKDGNTYKAGGNMYTFEYRAKAPVITVDDYTAGDVDIYDYETNKANFVFIKLENSRVTDIYTISNRANYTSSIITQSTDLK